MTVWLTLWLFWGVFFCLVEGVALFNKVSGDTLSEHFWRWLKVGAQMPTLLVWIGRIGLALFCTALGFHLSFGWFTPTHPWPF